MNPFDRIPNEILIHILSLSTHTADPGQVASYLDRDAVFPFTSLRLCKRWRDVTRSTPEIWAAAAIVSLPEGLPRLMEHARRCGDRPLDVSISIVDVDIGFQAFITRLRYDRDVKLLHKIKYLRMMYREKDFYSALGTMDRVMRGLTRFGGAVLERVELFAIEWMGPPNMWDEVASLLVLVFDSQPQLRSIRLGGFRSYIPQTTSYTRSLPKLEVLVLDDCDAYIIDILSYVDIPVLHTLSITCSGTPNPYPTASSVTMPARIAHIPSVQRLTLIHMPTLQDLKKVLSAVPNVRHLTLGGRWTLEAFDNEVEGFISHLESLKVMSLSTKTDMHKLKSVVASRLGTLQAVTLDLGRGVVPDVGESEEFKWLQEHVTLTLNAR
ncbi:hypothetical protein FRB94_009901 [Tulasnella sp. JGI-2019a]|nr:hypothetical protein FRB93_007913 [Tulasnella sp. JGI-2019a]KAG8994415.1 hypothetical protein FRB94_009901 [Tulasnella sp. JGI-2019a]